MVKVDCNFLSYNAVMIKMSLAGSIYRFSLNFPDVC